MRKHYNKKRKDMEPFKKGDLVLLNGRNIRAKHLARNWKIRCWDRSKFWQLEAILGIAN
jgi:hypothetical protein